MRSMCVVTVLLAAFVVGCGNNPPADAGPTDTGSGSADVVFTGGPACTDYARTCTTPTPYGTCCAMCPAGYTCGYADPGVDAGGGTTTTNICSATCINASECPTNGTHSAMCVRGLCYQSCDPMNAASCPELEQCTTIYGVNICTVVVCH